MADKRTLELKLSELAARKWDVAAIESRVKNLAAEGISHQTFKRDDLSADRHLILDRVQQRAEEYNYMFKNCAQGTALALMEEFGLGNMEIVKALTPFPGIGGTGKMCGGVTGSLIALGLYFGSDDRMNYEATGAAIMAAQKFMALFEGELGYQLCAEIHEHVIFGKNMDPGASESNMAAFAAAKGFEKCGLATGTGARLAAGVIIDGMV